DIGAGILLTATQFNKFISAADCLPNRFFRFEIVVLLVDISDLNGFSNLECSFIRLLFASDHFKQGGFSGTVGADNTYYACRRKRESEILIQQFVSVTLGNTFRFDNLIAE